MKLSKKQIRFCNEYLVDYNATQAAIRAGYSKKTGYSQGQRLLKNAEVKIFLQNKGNKIVNKLEASQERTMKEISRIAFFDIRNLFKEDGTLKAIHELDDDTAAVLASSEVEELFLGGNEGKIHIGNLKKLKLWDKLKALEMLAKHHKIYSDAPVNSNNIKFGYGPEVPV